MDHRAGRRLERARYHPLEQSSRQLRDARGPRLLAQKPLDPGLKVARLPTPHAGLGLARPAHDLDRADSIGRNQHDPPSVTSEKGDNYGINQR